MDERVAGWHSHLLVLGWVFSAILVLSGRQAAAGPPFLTDDPEPVAYRHWEAYLFSTVDKTTDARQVQGLAFECNYGVAPDLQAHVVFPFVSFDPEAGPSAYGAGDTEFGLKYRFIQEQGSVPQVGIFPMLEIPTGDASRGLGNGKAWAKLPVWAQKSWGPWTTYGGGGYAVNPASGQRDFPFGGWLLQRSLGDVLTLGGELFAQGKTTDTGKATAIANVGGICKFTEHFSLLFAVGRSVAGDRHLLGYVGLYWTW
jgi:hypothetical protein